MANIRFFGNIIPQAVQFENASGTETGRIGKSGDDLTITNAVGDVLFGDGLSDVYIGNGISSVDLLFEQSGAISAAAGSSITLTIGSADTTLALYAPTITNISTQASESTALMINGSNVVGTRELGSNAFNSAAYLLDTTDTFTGSLTIVGDIRGNGQQLILNAGESYLYATGQTDEYVYANAESGLQINSSPDNWATGWAGRTTATINAAGGGSTLPGTLGVAGVITAPDGNSTEWNTAYDNRITSLTTNGTSGAATLISNVLNIPNYADGQGVTSIITTNGITGGPISSTGTIQVDSTVLRTSSDQSASGIKTFTTRVKGNVGTPLDTFMMPQNPEGKHVSAPWFFNDMAYARLKGATVSVVVNGGSAPSTADIDAMLDASTGFWNMTTAGVTSVVITMSSLPKNMTYGSYMGLTFGNTNWRAQNITLESYYNGQWNTLETYTNQTEEFVIKSYNSSGNAQTQLRYTLSNFNTTSMRIVSLFAYNYNATGMPSLYATLDGFSMYGQVDMNQNKIIDLPTPTATTDAANKAYVDDKTWDWNDITTGTPPTFNQSTTGSAATLTTARTLTIGATGKTFNGSANVSWSLAEIGAQAALTNPITGTGTTNYLPKFTGSTALGNSLVYDNGTNVGIGTTSPNVPLEIKGADITTSSNTTAVSLLRLTRDITDSSFPSRKDSAVDFMVSRQQAVANNLPYTRLDIRLSGTTDSSTPTLDVMSLLYNGNVGIGTTSPNRSLHVIGQVAIDNSTSPSGGLLVSPDGTSNKVYSRTGNATSSAHPLDFISGSSTSMRIAADGNVGIGTTSPTSNKLVVAGGVDVWNSTNTLLRLGHNGTRGDIQAFTGGAYGILAINSGGGNVGIGTTAPNYKLEVNNTSAGNLTTALTLNNGSTTTNTAVALRLQTDPTSTVNSYSEIRSTRTNSPAAGGVAMRFLVTNSTTGAASEIMRLSYAGLGLGTAGTTTITDTRRGAFADGTAAAPAYSFSDDTNNGMYRITTDTLGFSTAGSEKLRISSAGNVGIGTTGPVFKLDVHNSGSGIRHYGDSTNQLETFCFGGYQTIIATNGSVTNEFGYAAGNFYVQTADTEKFRITSSGNVGIGTDSPAAKLHVEGNVRVLKDGGDGLENSGVYIGNAANNRAYNFQQNANGSSLNLWAYGGSSWANRVTFQAAGNVGIGTSNPSEKLDVNGNLIVSGNFNNLYVGGKTNSNVDGIRMLCAGDDSYIDCRGGSGLNFRLDDTTGDTQRIKFHSGGNVSIGNTNNTYKLDVQGTGNFAGNLQISTGDQQTTRLLLKNTNSTGGRTFALVGGIHNVTQDGFSIYDTVAAATRFTILNNGNVGIGTTSPGYQLQLSTNSAAKPTSNVWTVVSDSRVKENVRTYDSGLDKVLQIEPKLFDYNGKAGFEKTKDNVGIIAQEIKKILPETVNTYKAKLNEGDEEETELYSYDGHALTFALVNSIKELNKKIEKLETRIQTLENKQL
jgi:hypothetical protein